MREETYQRVTKMYINMLRTTSMSEATCYDLYDFVLKTFFLSLWPCSRTMLTYAATYVSLSLTSIQACLGLV